jgi:hypothetical protein
MNSIIIYISLLSLLYLTFTEGFLNRLSFPFNAKIFQSKPILKMNTTYFDENQNNNENNENNDKNKDKDADNYSQFIRFQNNCNPLYTILWYDCDDCKMLMDDMKKMHMNFEYIDIRSNLIMNKKIFAKLKLNPDKTTQKPTFLLNQEYFGNSLFEMYENMFLVNNLLK